MLITTQKDATMRNFLKKKKDSKKSSSSRGDGVSRPGASPPSESKSKSKSSSSKSKVRPPMTVPRRTHVGSWYLGKSNRTTLRSHLVILVTDSFGVLLRTLVRSIDLPTPLVDSNTRWKPY